MVNTSMATIDANEAVASVAYRLSEVVAIYPITPASPMGEHADEWSVSEAAEPVGFGPRRDRDAVRRRRRGRGARGVAGRCADDDVHGVAGPAADDPEPVQDRRGAHRAAASTSRRRSVATHALSIFGDHSDVMAARQTGFAMLASGSPQEAADLAAIAHAATLACAGAVPAFLRRVPHLARDPEDRHRSTTPPLQALVDDDAIAAHRARALSPDHPVVRGTAQNPDTFFQAREAANPFYDACPSVVADTMDRFGELTGRRYGCSTTSGIPKPNGSW